MLTIFGLVYLGLSAMHLVADLVIAGRDYSMIVMIIRAVIRPPYFIYTTIRHRTFVW
ncbi:MAG: hypothetical protein UV78_C0025G0010 [Parcubacteria group bacterium GW2011_GWA2_43_17]|nr:MAG: hypothetical protein UV78_C0025G0010 [Parcubacteria group bacterium GW2011_GWA2_43_17]KKT94368.1 MAG: hypothetical protein UW91_C0002G0012 [Parcubacteria group bacterium GW2011_GWF2_45_11]KKT98712.1 MAG: hypothetical protein UW98_C0005G0032 [Parcubacteria group bacterium GW2011_GWC2_45_15]